MRAGSRPSAAALTMWWARSNAVVSRRVPLTAVPMGVRSADTMTASGMGGLQLGQEGAAQQFSGLGLGEFGSEHDGVRCLGRAEPVLDPLPDLGRVARADDDG